MLGFFVDQSEARKFFCPNMESSNLPQITQIMAAAHVKAAKKLTRAKIRAISLAGKALSEEDVFDRVCRETRGTFSFYFESSLAGEVDRLVSSVLFRRFIKSCSETFFDFFCEKAKGRSCDKYAVLQVRWYEFVRQMLDSQEVSEIVKDMSQGKNVVSCFLESVFGAGFKFVRERQEDSSGSINVSTGRMDIVEDDASMLKLGSAAVLNLKRRLRKIAGHSLDPNKALRTWCQKKSRLLSNWRILKRKMSRVSYKIWTRETYWC